MTEHPGLGPPTDISADDLEVDADTGSTLDAETEPDHDDPADGTTTHSGLDGADPSEGGAG